MVAVLPSRTQDSSADLVHGAKLHVKNDHLENQFFKIMSLKKRFFHHSMSTFTEFPTFSASANF
jgi:hypothetical protein